MDYKNPLVTFGFINCNRLFYLKSCVESLLKCTQDYENKELIIVDNASIETGTDEYLSDLESRGYTVVRNTTRDPNNEFARALNTIIEKANGKYVCPLAGDMQFIVEGGWLKDYVDVYENLSDHVGSILFDAQRALRINTGYYSNTFGDNLGFVFDYKRGPFAPSCNSFFSKEKVEKYIGKWSTNKGAHEGEMSAEAEVDNKIKTMKAKGEILWNQLMPMHPVSVAIYTDSRGTMGRIRGNRMFGDYWEAKKDNLYYELVSYENACKAQYNNIDKPQSIEQVVKTIGYDAPIDEHGSWKKMHLSPSDAKPEDWRDVV